jgi:hypothetical protein
MHRRHHQQQQQQQQQQQLEGIWHVHKAYSHVAKALSHFLRAQHSTKFQLTTTLLQQQLSLLLNMRALNRIQPTSIPLSGSGMST